jgi:hypothetical protein
MREASLAAQMIYPRCSTSPNMVFCPSKLTNVAELSIKPEINDKLVPTFARGALGFDYDNFVPLRPEQLLATLD